MISDTIHYIVFPPKWQSMLGRPALFSYRPDFFEVSIYRPAEPLSCHIIQSADKTAFNYQIYMRCQQLGLIDHGQTV